MDNDIVLKTVDISEEIVLKLVRTRIERNFEDYWHIYVRGERSMYIYNDVENALIRALAEWGGNDNMTTAAAKLLLGK